MLLLIQHGSQAVATIRSCSAPEIVLASLREVAGNWCFEGDSSLWGDPLPLLVKGRRHHTDLVVVAGQAETVTRHELHWFFEGDYDFGYQGPVECLAMPEAGVVLVAVARSSVLTTIDIGTGQKVGEIALAGRGGAQRLTRMSESTFIATDYDVVCLADLTKGLVRASEVLQPPKPPNTRQFIGGYGYDLGGVLAVARTFSRDVVKLDPETFEVLDRSWILRRPLDVCMISERKFVTRAWRNGRVSTGVFRS